MFIRKQKGMTLIELIVVIAIIGIIATVFFGNRSNTKCVGGFLFSNDYRHSTQVLDENGHGIKCDVK